jgi:hypothetical protein
MLRRRLNEPLMEKLRKKLGKRDLVVVNKLISAEARRRGISSEAALVVLATKNSIGASIYQRSLDATKQAEIHRVLAAPAASATRTPARSAGHATGSSRAATSDRVRLRAAVDYLIADTELHSRCADILMGPRNFDRAINQATLVLEDRLRTKAEPLSRMVGENLVGYAFNEDLARTVLRVDSNNPDDQRGLTQMLRGIVPAFRNSTHHHIINFSREEAMRICGFVDVLLRVVDNAVKVR